MSKTFSVVLAAPDNQLYVGEIEQINLPSSEGEVGIRVGHMPAIIALRAGVVEIISEMGKSPDHFAITGGFAEVLGDKVSVLVLSGEQADSLKEEAILEAKQKAEQAKINAQNNEEFAEASSELERALAQLKTINRRKRWRK